MNGIGLREASRKYNVPDSTLSDWVSKGLIRKLQDRQLRGQPMLLCEPDVAAMAKQYRPGRSRWNRPSLEKLTPAS